MTAIQRRKCLRSSQTIIGSMPTARNSATTIRISMPRAARSTSITAYVTATPAAALRPMKNSERRSNLGPGSPSGRTGVANAAASRSASAIGSAALTSLSESGEVSAELGSIQATSRSARLPGTGVSTRAVAGSTSRLLRSASCQRETGSYHSDDRHSDGDAGPTVALPVDVVESDQ